MKYLFAFFLCLMLLQPLAAESLIQPYETEHADIARLVHELNHLAKETRKLEQKYRSDSVLLEFNYSRLINILEQEISEIRGFINLKDQTPDVAGFKQLHSLGANR